MSHPIHIVKIYFAFLTWCGKRAYTRGHNFWHPSVIHIEGKGVQTLLSPTVPILYSTTPSTHAIVCKGGGLQSLSILRIKHELAYLTLSKLGYFIIDFPQKLTYYDHHHPPLSHTFWTCLLNFWWLALVFFYKGYLSDVSSKRQRWAWKKGGNYMRKWGKVACNHFLSRSGFLHYLLEQFSFGHRSGIDPSKAYSSAFCFHLFA